MMQKKIEILKILASGQKKLHEISDIAQFPEATTHRILQQLIEEKEIKKIKWGVYMLKKEEETIEIKNGKMENTGYIRTHTTRGKETSMHRIVEIVVEETKNGNPNITNKLLSERTGFKKSWINKLCKIAEEKGLIKRRNMGMFVHNEPTIYAFNLVKSSSALHAPEDMINGKFLRLETRPNNFRFKVQVLRGVPPPHWEEIEMRSWICRWSHDYGISIQWTPRHAIIYIPAFNSQDLFFAFFETFQKLRNVLKSLKKDYNYKFGQIQLITAHNAIVNDPLALLAKFRGVIKDKDNRLQLDKSEGFNELEAIKTEYSEEDVQKIIDFIYNPVVTGKYNPWHLLEQIQKTEVILRQNIETHISAVAKIDTGSEKLTTAAFTLVRVVQNLEVITNSLRESIEPLKQLTLDKFMEGKKE